MRYSYALYQAWKHRLALGHYARDEEKQIPSITELTPARVSELNCQYLVLDFDGVLASHGEMTLPTEVASWLANFLSQANLQGCFILSNKPKKTRYEYFKTHFPDIKFIKAPRKKPYPDGLKAIIAQTQAQAEHVLLIDDRLLTGCLAAILAGCQCLRVTQPLMNVAKRPIVERFFCFLRWMELKLFA